MNLSHLKQNLRSGWVQLAHSKSVSLIVVLILALVIGANASVLWIADRLLLDPLPHPEPQQLMSVWNVVGSRNIDRGRLAPPEFDEIREQMGDAFQSVAAYQGRGFLLRRGDWPVQTSGALVTTDFFEVFADPPLLGQTFDQEACQEKNLVVLSHSLWIRAFDRSDEVLGQTIDLDEQSYRVLGVMPAHFAFPTWADFWIASCPSPSSKTYHRENHYLRLVARLAPDMSPEAAKAALKLHAERLRREHPESYPEEIGWDQQLIPLEELTNELRRPMLLILLGVGACIFILAAANVATLLLARSNSRRGELVVRQMMGARFKTLVYQLLTENLLLTVLAGLISFPIGLAIHHGLVYLAHSDLDLDQNVMPFWELLPWSLGLSIIAGLVVTVPPIAHALGHQDLNLKDAGRTLTDAKGRRILALLLVVEVALTIALLCGAALMTQSFRNLIAVDPGFEAEGVLAIRANLSHGKFRQNDAQLAFYHELLPALSALPGVEKVATTSSVPIDGRRWTLPFMAEAGSASDDTLPQADILVVSPQYFKTMGITLRGRSFSASDHAEAPKVAIINEHLATSQFGDRNPMGLRLRLGGRDEDTPFLTVVGVAASARHTSLTEEFRSQIYLPFPQYPLRSLNVLLETSMDPASLGPMVRTHVAQIEPVVAIEVVDSMEGLLWRSLARHRFTALVINACALLGILLAALGLYGVTAYSLERQHREFGIRALLGASPKSLRSMIYRRALLIATAGAILGFGLSIAIGRWLSSLLFGVKPFDTSSLMLALAVTLTIILAATLGPTQSILRRPISELLRSE